MPANLTDNPGQISEYSCFIISHDAKSLPEQKGISFLVMQTLLGFLMHGAVNLDDEPGFQADEVDDAHGQLPSELPAVETLSTKFPPESCLKRRLRASEAFGEPALMVRDVADRIILQL